MPVTFCFVFLFGQRQGKIVAGGEIFRRLPVGRLEIEFGRRIVLLKQGDQAAKQLGLQRLGVELQGRRRLLLSLRRICSFPKPIGRRPDGYRYPSAPSSTRQSSTSGVLLIAGLRVKLGDRRLGRQNLVEPDLHGLACILLQGALHVFLLELALGELLQSRRALRIRLEPFFEFSSGRRPSPRGLRPSSPSPP